MKGYIEIKEDSYEDTLEYLHKIKTLACKLMKSLEKRDDEDDDEEYSSRRKGRYNY